MKGLGFAFLFLANTAAAQVIPEPGASNPRLQTVRWQEGQTIQLTALPGTGLTVTLSPGEKIGNIDFPRAAVDARISSEGDALLLIPRQEGQLGHVHVTTDRRRYRFALRTGTDLMAAYLVRLVDRPGTPELPPAMAVNAPAGYSQAPSVARSGNGIGAQGWSYRIKGDPAVRPASVRDDGARTLISFTPGAAMPAVFAIGPSGGEQVVNGYMRGDVFVIDEVWQSLVFRIDRRTASARRNAKPGNSHD